jgi:hypothetical protein
VTEPGETRPFSYLEQVVEDRLRELDPAALPPKAPKFGGFGQGQSPDMTDPQIQKILEQIKQKGGAPK